MSKSPMLVPAHYDLLRIIAREIVASELNKNTKDQEIQNDSQFRTNRVLGDFKKTG